MLQTKCIVGSTLEPGSMSSVRTDLISIKSHSYVVFNVLAWTCWQWKIARFEKLWVAMLVNTLPAFCVSRMSIIVFIVFEGLGFWNPFWATWKLPTSSHLVIFFKRLDVFVWGFAFFVCPLYAVCFCSIILFYSGTLIALSEEQNSDSCPVSLCFDSE